MFLGQADVAADLLNLCLSKYAKGRLRILPGHLIRLDPAHYNVVFGKNGMCKSDAEAEGVLASARIPEKEIPDIGHERCAVSVHLASEGAERRAFQRSAQRAC